MSRPFEVFRCSGCGHVVYPPRSLCPRCWGESWERLEAVRGVVEERTWRVHRVREERRHPVEQWWDLHRVPIAFVRTDAGPLVVAWSPDDAEPGAAVRLEVESGVPVARNDGQA